MQDKTDQPGQGDIQDKDLPKRPGEYGPDDVGKKGGSGEVDRRGGQGGPQPGTEKKV